MGPAAVPSVRGSHTSGPATSAAYPGGTPSSPWSTWRRWRNMDPSTAGRTPTPARRFSNSPRGGSRSSPRTIHWHRRRDGPERPVRGSAAGAGSAGYCVAGQTTAAASPSGGAAGAGPPTSAWGEEPPRTGCLHPGGRHPVSKETGHLDCPRQHAGAGGLLRSLPRPGSGRCRGCWCRAGVVLVLVSYWCWCRVGAAAGLPLPGNAVAGAGRGAWPSAAPGGRNEAHAPGGATLDSLHPRRRRGRARPYCGIRGPCRALSLRDPGPDGRHRAVRGIHHHCSIPTPLPNRHRGRCVPPRRPPRCSPAGISRGCRSGGRNGEGEPGEREKRSRFPSGRHPLQP